MTFHEPTQGGLKAQAGWALMKRSSTTPEHVVALDKYRDGCEALIPYANSGTAEQRAADVKLPAVPAMPSRLETPIVADPPVLAENCNHRFNIHDQRCLHCGATRFQALAQRGRTPELVLP
jgi:hypothetical protein